MITSASEDSANRQLPTWWAMSLLAVLVPTLVAHHEPPSVTFFNQVLAVLGWGFFIAVLGGQPRAATHGPKGLALSCLSAMLLICALEAFGSAFVWGALPAGLGLMGGGMALGAWLTLRAGWRAGQSIDRLAIAETFFGALTAAGVAGMVLALIQVFHPGWADGIFVAEPTMPGRAVGNLRQPNHFSTLLVFSCAGAAWMGARRRLPGWLAAALVTFFIWGIVLTASRTGMVGMIFLTVWGLVDRRLPKVLRAALIGAPVIYGLCWGGMWLWAHAHKGVTFAAEARLHDGSDISSSRFKIWANVWELIKTHPWLGVGYGEFNLAWTFTPFPTRPVAFFDHTHNLPMQWAVEFGLPVTALLLMLALLGVYALFIGLSKQDAHDDSGVISTVGACSVIVAIAALHSLLEYPLWYSYFLLPTAFAWGLGLSIQAERQQQEPRQTAGRGMLAAGLLMSALSLWCATDYWSAVNIYAPRKGAGPLDKRIENGMKHIWWGYQADYADVTSVDEEDPSKPPAAFKRTLHNLVDARLMAAYARSLAEHGQEDKGRYVVQRLKEFRNPLGDEFLSVCKTQLEPGEERPFQCEEPKQRYTWRELLP
ncbi:MAG TPA: Wzy polymerase domain-containing protein [Aquabacterium sp.]|uniref:PglL family O-oligosaccharyltransferase n=1 Tax=Aquabacterium sp. TaxID=1872578 RepID=UPI002E35DA2A|nr:Wzy polymerase domain-containing protein [Aquabacterium sp.]HEX5354699.1 Wzy polymerase domain-containing protein [Aquabacterium sp.]